MIRLPLGLFPLGLPLPLVCFGFAPLKGGGISASSLSTECAIWEYNPGTVAPVVTMGIAGVGGSHFHIICSRDCFVFCLSPIFTYN